MQNIFHNREISALAFNERVLQEAEDPRNPLMERLRFLGIFSSNMDEFFKVRVASIQRRLELGKGRMNAVLELIGDRTRDLDRRFQKSYATITAALADEGVRILTERDVAGKGPKITEWLEDYFHTNVLPTLVPIIVDERHKFPQLTDGALYFAVRMWGGENPPYAILEIPSELRRFVELPDGSIMYLDDVIRYNLNEVFYIFRYDQIAAYEFKISRDAELDIDNDFSEGYIRKMERVLEQRKGGRPTRFVCDRTIPPGLQKLLLAALQITSDDTVIGGGRYHNMKDLMNFPNERPELAFPVLDPVPHPVLERERTILFDQILEQDVLVTYPYQSFDLIVRLLREAAIDPKVDEIKLTLYRAAKRSQIVNALVNAARNGKNVFVSVELMARFDERNNIVMAERLSEVGATVVYGVPPMKVHAKLFSIRRGDQIVSGLSTGNFHETTGKLYVDSTLLTANKEIAEDVDQVFHFLHRASITRTIATPRFKHLIVSPFKSRQALTKLIRREAKKGDRGYIFLKVNHLTDPKLAREFHDAADAGVKMDIVVRTTYSMKPHPNIRAISILDRFLEHQRVYIFGKGEDRRVFLCSCDLMERNMDWRVESVFPILSEPLKKEICDLMELQIADKAKARIMDEEQTNRYAGEQHEKATAQELSYRYYQEMYERSLADQEANQRRPRAIASS